MIKIMKLAFLKLNSKKSIEKSDMKDIYYIIFLNWFTLFAMPRTIINSFETMLFSLAFYNYLKYI